MNYIVFDLEWNQSNTGREPEVERLPFEVIEIGAVKLNDSCVMIDQFSEIVKPQVYQEMHRITSRIIHMKMQELMRGDPFPMVVGRFFRWCGDDTISCTWGSMDLTELQRNMEFHNMTPLSDRPIPFLDVQKLFAIAQGERKQRRSLEDAVDELGIEKDIPFHRAFSDAYYTAKVLKAIYDEKPEVLRYVSYDLYHPPASRESEVRVEFDTYFKHITRQFPDKQAALADKEVLSGKCYRCHRNLRKKIRWFTPNGRHFYCAAYCEKHGYIKGKLRVRKGDGEQVYIVKTLKYIGEEEFRELAEKRDRAGEARRRRHSRRKKPGNSPELTER